VCAFPLAVQVKYREDHGGYLAAMVTYYAFLSLFPLLMVATTVLGFVLRGHPGLQHDVGRSVLGSFPIVGHDVRVHALRGSGVALAVGLALAAWAGTRGFIAAESVMNQVWGIPERRRPRFVAAHARGFLLALVFGAAAVATSALNAFGTVGAGQGPPWRIGSLAASVAGNVALLLVVFRLLTADQVSWRQLRRGAVLAGLGWALLQAGGSLYVHHVVAAASNTYGTFATVIGLLSFIYLSVLIALIAAETNVVAARRLWPRSLSIADGEPITDGDRRALELREALANDGVADRRGRLPEPDQQAR
jgi:YihY family inner membrane protein